MQIEYIYISLLLLSAFFIGAFPTGFLLVKAIKGVDIRAIGSGNIGSTNVKRIAGGQAAIITQVVDIAKGAFSVLLCNAFLNFYEITFDNRALVVAAALTAIVGHNFSPFLNFKGGKGVNTTIGSFLIIAFIPTVIAVIFYFALRLSTGIVSTGSIAIGISLPIAMAYFNYPFPTLVGAIIAGGLILIQHKDNIARLISGEEPSTKI